MARIPGDGVTAHSDTFARDRLPPKDLWPDFDFSGLPEMAAYPDRMNAAVELLDKAVAELGWAGRPCIRYDGHVWTYADVKAKADAVARVLVEDMGLETGHRVLLRGPNNPMMAACWMAVLKAGGIVVATMPLLRARELAYMAEKAEIRHFLCDIDLRAEGDGAMEQAPILHKVKYFTALGDGSDRAANLDTAMARKPTGFDNVDTAADDIGLIAFTSGTTGQPKGTVHFHRDILAMCDCFPKHVYRPSPDDIYVGTPPLAFTFGLGAQLLFPMRTGASVVFYPGPPGPDRMLDLIDEHRCTTLYTAPTMYRALADKISESDNPPSTLKQCVSAGETLPLPTFEAFRAATGIRIIDGLGSTEMIHIFVSAEGDDIRPGATGTAIPGYDACIMDEAGNILEPPCEGLLATRGPTGCKYLDNEERQRAYVVNGWNLPGDRYRQDAEGYFWYVARARRHDRVRRLQYRRSGGRGCVARPSQRQGMRRGRHTRRAARPDRQGVRDPARSGRCRRGRREGTAGFREGRDRTLQVSARHRIRARPAAHGNRQGPALQAAPAGGKKGPRTGHSRAMRRGAGPGGADAATVVSFIATVVEFVASAGAQPPPGSVQGRA